MNDRPYRVLVIDDTMAIHEDFKKILCMDRRHSSKREALEATLFGSANPLGKQRQFTIDSAYQGKEGLARVHHALQEGEPYVMAFVDVRMPPGLDGIEVTPMLLKADPNLQIIICTAYSDYSWEEMFAKVGASDRMFILQKPFDRMEVLQLTHTLAEKRRLQMKKLEQASESLHTQILQLKKEARAKSEE